MVFTKGNTNRECYYFWDGVDGVDGVDGEGICEEIFGSEVFRG